MEDMMGDGIEDLEGRFFGCGECLRHGIDRHR